MMAGQSGSAGEAVVGHPVWQVGQTSKTVPHIYLRLTILCDCRHAAHSAAACLNVPLFFFSRPHDLAFVTALRRLPGDHDRLC